MKIRKGSTKDLQECVKLSRIPEFVSVVEKSDKEIKDYLREYFDRGFFFVAEEDSRIMGFIAAEKMLGRVAWIDMLTVRKDERSKGLGKMLLDKMRSELRKNKIKSICLMAPKFNRRTQKFYKNSGLTAGKDFVEFTEEL